MASTDASSDDRRVRRRALSGVDMALEVVTLPVSDVDRAKDFYERIGWRLDIDLVVSDDIRTVQFTPPHSQCSIQFGTGGTAAEPGSIDGLILVVKDIDAARNELISRGVDGQRGGARCGPRASSRAGARTSRARGSATRTATAGCSRRSPTRLPGREWDD